MTDLSASTALMTCRPRPNTARHFIARATAENAVRIQIAIAPIGVLRLIPTSAAMNYTAHEPDNRGTARP
jgi:hypothetical protein